MPTTHTIPVTVAPEASARVAELGLTVAFERMVDKVLCLVPGLLEVRVLLVPDSEEGGEPGIVLRALADTRAGGDPASWRRWREWLTAAYPPDVYRHFTLLTPCVENAHAG